MKHCIYCGQELKDEAILCIFCGNEQVASEDAGHNEALPEIDLVKKSETVLNAASTTNKPADTPNPINAIGPQIIKPVTTAAKPKPTSKPSPAPKPAPALAAAPKPKNQAAPSAKQPSNFSYSTNQTEPSSAKAVWALIFTVLIITSPIGFAMAVSYLRQGGQARKGRAITAILLSIFAMVVLVIGGFKYLRPKIGANRNQAAIQQESSEATTAPSTVEARFQTSTASETVTETETEPAEPEYIYKVIVNTGRIRKGPGTDTDTICFVYLDDELKGTGKSEKIVNTTWYEVYYDDTDATGWASEIVIVPIEPESNEEKQE